MTDINTLLDEFAECNFQCGAMNVDDTVKYREMVDRTLKIRNAIIAFYSEQSRWVEESPGEEDPECLDIPMFLRRQAD